MAIKKQDFSGINTGKVYQSIELATSRNGRQGEASPQEQAERKAGMKTQGRRGCRAIRINMAFTPENHEFITVMAKASGRSMTEFINLVLEAYRREHPEILAKAQAFLDTVNLEAFSDRDAAGK